MNHTDVKCKYKSEEYLPQGASYVRLNAHVRDNNKYPTVYHSTIEHAPIDSLNKTSQFCLMIDSRKMKPSEAIRNFYFKERKKAHR